MDSMSDETIKIGGRDVDPEYILDVYVDGYKWMVSVWGESSIEIDPTTVDDVIRLNRKVVDEEIIRDRDTAATAWKWLK